MTIRDINDIIAAVCPNDEDYEKPCISPKYLRQELEQLALEQEQKMLESTTKNDLGVEKIIDEIEQEFEKVDIPIMDKLTLFAKVQNSLYRCAELRNSKAPTGSTTKNDLGVEKIVDVLGSYTDLDIPYKHKIAEDILNNLPSVTPQEPCDKCEVGNPCLYCKHEFEPQESEDT